VTIATLEARGVVRRSASELREELVSEAAMTVASQVDEALRDLASRRMVEFDPELGKALVDVAVESLAANTSPSLVFRPMKPGDPRLTR